MLNEGYIAYWTKFIPVEQHEEYTGPDKLKHGETEMISKMHGMLQKAFKVRQSCFGSCKETK